jgi:hypothetical protein
MFVVYLCFQWDSELKKVNYYESQYKERLIWEIREFNQQLGQISLTLSKFENVSTETESELFKLIVKHDLLEIRGSTQRIKYLYFHVYPKRETLYFHQIRGFFNEFPEKLYLALNTFESEKFDSTSELLLYTKNDLNSLINDDININGNSLFTNENIDGQIVEILERAINELNEIIITHY